MGGLRFHRHWIACALLVPAAAGAHHSRTQYDGSEVQEIQGELIAVSWANPHATFSVRVTSASGESATWQLESWGSPYVLSRMGVTQDQFVVGTEVRLAGRASTLKPNRFLLTNMLRPDGTEVVLTTLSDPLMMPGEYLAPSHRFSSQCVQGTSSGARYESKSVHVHRTRRASESIQSARHTRIPTD